MEDRSAELVRINDKGEAHPIGVVASRRMRERVGTFRVLPAPRHVVLMRYTGEDGRRDAEDGAIVRLSGEITAPCALLDVLAMLAQTRAQGELVVLSSEAERTVFLENGNIVGAETSVEEERLGQVMYRFGALGEEQHHAIMQRVSEGARFGQTAAELGLVTSEQVYLYLGKQLEEIVYACLALDEVRYFRQKIPDASWIPVRSDRTHAPQEEYRRVHEAVDGNLSIAELGRVTGGGEFETTKAIYALMQSKHVVLRPPRILGGPQEVIALANQALAAIHARLDAEGAGDELRQALAGFAAGAGMFEMILSDAGPRPDGTFDPARADNVAVAAGADPETFLKLVLYEYVSFALFCTGSASPAIEQSLASELHEVLARLQPHGV